MKLFKALIATTLVMMGSQVVLADEPVVEKYHYGTHLDIAKVLKRDPIPNVCGVAPIQMVYLDRKGEKHILEYLVLGNGCFDS